MQHRHHHHKSRKSHFPQTGVGIIIKRKKQEHWNSLLHILSPGRDDYQAGTGLLAQVICIMTQQNFKMKVVPYSSWALKISTIQPQEQAIYY